MIGSDYQDYSKVKDLIDLPLLDENIILEVLAERYKFAEIYTSTDCVLLAVNPFHAVPHLYGKDVMQIYNVSDTTSLKLLNPHPWKTAAKSYSRLVKTGLESWTLTDPLDIFNSPSQSILISGESGAGKTETTKVIMSFLAQISSDNDEQICEDHHMGSVQQQVLHSNPILEAYGNARTVRNDNSSRFGKYIKLLFSDKKKLVGVSLNTFLLEMPRLIGQSANERNFHIFYLLDAGLDSKTKSNYHFKSLENYYYLNQSHCYQRRDGVSDKVLYEQLIDSFLILGFENIEIEDLFSITIAIISLGNLKFLSQVSASGENETVLTDDCREYLECICHLLQIPQETLINMLTTKDIFVAGEILQTKLDADQAIQTRDALSKSIYLALFNWILDFLNIKMCSLNEDDVQFIGLLDIFGFECLERNSFEQLLINYANECLQQQFNTIMIENEQQLYIEEGIRWDFIDFPSNKDCIDFIANKKLSILSLLHEASVTPSGSDISFVNRIYTGLADHPRLIVSSMAKAKNLFGVKHYAGAVWYDSLDFVSKNKGRVCPYNKVLSQSISGFVRYLGETYDLSKEASRRNSSTSTGSTTTSTVLASNLNSTNSISFRESLNELLATIGSTDAHYIRCLKPNNENIRDCFNTERMRDQLQSGGILQTISVIRAGFPIRFKIDEFYYHFRYFIPFLTPMERTNSTRDKIQAIIIYIARLEHMEFSTFEDLQLNIGIQLGYTKIFFRQDTYNRLNNIRKEAELKCIVRLQAIGRRLLYRSIFKMKIRAIIQIQNVCRMYIARWKYRCTRAASIVLQTYYRRFIALRRFMKVKRAVKRLQLWWSVALQRARYVAIAQDTASRLIQQWWCNMSLRRHLSHAIIEKQRNRNARKIQCVWRRYSIRKGIRNKVGKRIARWIAAAYHGKKSWAIKQELLEKKSLLAITAAGPFLTLQSPQQKQKRKTKLTICVPNDMSEGAKQVFHANRHVLWEIALFYSNTRPDLSSPSSLSSSLHAGTFLTLQSHPGFSTSSSPRGRSPSSGRVLQASLHSGGSPSLSLPSPSSNNLHNHIPMLPGAAMCTFAKDWGITPQLIGKNLLMDMIMNVLETQDWEYEDTRLSFIQFQKVLYMIAIRLEGFPIFITEEDRIRFLFRVMNNSSGKSRYMQSRNVSVLPKFVNIDVLKSLIPPEPELQIEARHLLRTKSCEMNLARQKKEEIKSLPKLMVQNQSILWSIFKCYALCYADVNNRSTISTRITTSSSSTSSTSFSTNSSFNNNKSKNNISVHNTRRMSLDLRIDTDNGHSSSSSSYISQRSSSEVKTMHYHRPGGAHILSDDALWNLLRDFDVCPGICSKSYLKTTVLSITSSHTSHVTFFEFLKLLHKIASDKITVNGYHNLADRRLNALFVSMDKSEGRMKFVQLARNASILPSFVVIQEVEGEDSSGSANNSTDYVDVDDLKPSVSEPSSDNEEGESPSRHNHNQHLHPLNGAYGHRKKTPDSGEKKPKRSSSLNNLRSVIRGRARANESARVHFPEDTY